MNTLKTRLRQVANRITLSSIPGLAATPSFVATVQHVSALYPHESDKDTYTLPAFPTAASETNTLPVPPEPLWATYCSDAESWVQSGLDDVATMRRLVAASGASVEDLGAVLDFGVAAGRLIRHLADVAAKQEVWGVDVWATAILWCQENLSPPFNFATTTVLPHLPFEDRYFGLVMAGSVWTHLDDLAEAWALEMRRVLKPGGRLYFTINDRAAAEIFEGAGNETDRKRYIDRVRPDEWQRWIERLHGNEGYAKFLAGEAQMVTIGRSTHAQVLWDSAHLLRRWGKGWRVCSITPQAYGHQTGILLERI